MADGGFDSDGRERARAAVPLQEAPHDLFLPRRHGAVAERVVPRLLAQVRHHERVDAHARRTAREAPRRQFVPEVHSAPMFETRRLRPAKQGLAGSLAEAGRSWPKPEAAL